jgi:hypothetical protein
MSDWGQGAKNNTIGYGQGACDNTIGWGTSQKDNNSWSGDTDISGCSGAAGLAQIDNLNSMSFDGASDFILLNNSNDTLNVDYLTISIWFKPNVITSFGDTIINNTYFNSGFMSWGITCYANRTVRFISSRTGSKFTTELFNLGEWNHFAVTYDNTNGLTLYLNGGTPINPYIGTLPLNYNTGFVSNNVTIGSAAAGGSASSPTGPTQHFNGLIDEVGIFNTALTDAEILSIYNATSVVDGVNKTADLSQLTTPPIAWYRM